MKKKILLVASSPASGMIPFAVTIINALANDNHFDVRCICVNKGKYTYKDKIDSCANPVFVEYPQSKVERALFLLWPKKIIKEIKKCDRLWNPDIIHLLTCDFSLAGFLLFQKDISKYYYTVHDLYRHELSNVASIGELIVRQIIYKGGDICREHIENLTTSSRSQLEELKFMYPSKHCIFTPFPTLITKQIMEGGKTVPELVNIDNYILFFGSVDLYKGVDLLVKAYNRSKAKGKCNLVIAGKGKDLFPSRNGIIRLNRFIDDSEIKCLFSHAKFIVYPYRSATMSGVLSIALYFKKQVLASDIPFFLEYKCDSIQYFKTSNIDDLTCNLNMLSDSGESGTSDQDYNYFYSIDNLTKAYLRLYRMADENNRQFI